MPTATPRQNRRAKRLRSIKDAALDLVMEDGLEGFSVHRLAERVDLTAGALYRYFESRDEMLISVQAEVLEVFDRYLAIVLADAVALPILEQVTLACRAYVALAELQPQRFQLNAQFISAPRPLFDTEVVQQTAARTLQMLARLGALIAEAQRAGVLREGRVEHRAVLAWSSVHGLVERKKLERLAPATFSPESLLDELLMTLLLGWGATHEAAESAVNKSVSMDELRAAMVRAEAQTEVD